MQHLAVLSWPFLPRAAVRLLEMLGLSDRAVRWEPPMPLAAGHALGEPEILFTKLEPDCMG